MEWRGADVREEPTDAPGATRTSSAPATPRTSTAPDTTRTSSAPGGAGEQVVPVVEERLKVGKRDVGGGRVRVYSRVTEQPIEEEVRLRDERVSVERRPVDRPLREGERAEFREDVIELTEVSEEPVVVKEARVVEEVAIGKDVQERTETIRDTVRRTDVQVERGETAERDRSLAQYESEWRRHHGAAGSGFTYEQFAPAYRYGAELVGRQRGGDWAALESDARRGWEEHHPGTWERFKDAIRHGWLTLRGESRAA
jgi:uncharacterized protein (TIGR02271 family)